MGQCTNIDTWILENAERAKRPCTWEDMDAACYSDAYKDAYGFRPRHTEVPFETVGEMYVEIDRLVSSWA